MNRDFPFDFIIGTPTRNGINNTTLTYDDKTNRKALETAGAASIALAALFLRACFAKTNIENLRQAQVLEIAQANGPLEFRSVEMR